MDWKGLLFYLGIPLGAFLADLMMRYLIAQKSLEFLDYCYGPDLGLTAIVTGFASLSDLNRHDPNLVGGVLFLLFVIWLITLIVHKGFEPRIDSSELKVRVAAKLMVAALGNLMGATSLFTVLWLIWKK